MYFFLSCQLSLSFAHSNIQIFSTKKMLFQAAGKFEIPIVVEQLRYCGIVETVKIRKAGYPIRYLYADFIKT